MAYSWQSDIIRPDGENGTEVLDGQGVYQPQLEGGDNITIEDGRINASGTLENVQADYTENDTSAPSYIKHKPDLSIYATASGMETALAGKQDVIGDLSTIRSGAEKGDTAVQPGDLASVAFSGSYTSLSNTPQNIVQDASYVHTDNNFTNADKGKLDGIAAGAEVNVQADWSEADPSSDAYIANKPTIPSVDQTYNASSTNAQSGTAVAQAIAAIPAPSVDEVPDVTSSDDGKVLTASYSGGTGSYSWQPSSGGASYTAGDGIDIDNDEISVYHDNTLSVTRSYGTALNLQPFSETNYVFETNSYFKGWVANGSAGEYLRVSIPADAFVYVSEGYTASLGISDDNNTAFYPIQLSATSIGGGVSVIDAQTIDLPLLVDSSTGWEGSINPSSSNLWLVIAQIQSGSVSGYASYYYNPRKFIPVAKSNPGGAIAVSNPLPASAQADSGKVLKVDSNGNPTWGPDGFTTTAGITDIQQVAALPANPVATVLYLIPET